MKKDEKFEKKDKRKDKTIYVVPSAPADLASDVLDGSSGHINDQRFLYGFSREGPSYPGLPIICWNVCPSSGCSYQHSI